MRLAASVSASTSLRGYTTRTRCRQGVGHSSQLKHCGRNEYCGVLCKNGHRLLEASWSCGDRGSSGDVVMWVADNKDKQGELVVVSVARAVS